VIISETGKDITDEYNSWHKIPKIIFGNSSNEKEWLKEIINVCNNWSYGIPIQSGSWRNT
jgi:hypothetical protein